MRLEMTEMLMALEAEFGIEIDDEANDIRTVGDLHDYIMTRLELRPAERFCLSDEAFGKLRQALAEQLDVREADIVAGAKMEDLVPRKGRRAHWRAVSKRLGWRLPELCRPPYLKVLQWMLCSPLLICWTALFLATAFILFVYSEVPLIARCFHVLAVLWLYVTGPWLCYRFTLFLVKPWANRFPSDCETFAGVVHAVTRLNRRFIARQDESTARGAPERCGSPPTFFTLRAALMDRLGLAKHRVQLDTKMSDLIPRKNRRPLWRELGEALDWRLPRLRRPTSLVLSVGLLWLICGAVTFGILAPFVQSQGFGTKWAVAGCVAAYALLTWPYYYLASRLTTPLAVCFPSGCATVGKAVMNLLFLNRDKIVPKGQRTSEEKVWWRMKEIIVERLDVKPHEVTRDARFFEDLGAS
ncbi:MAG TPA: hypothetical protein HPP77_06140 [Candidatus Hydrogenedentes bacterium]|nr:hypothetical protein [Candidatus Hydrogenedentota bacterium]HIJ72812.1 hypothetical protein [Candidatus Hydrogenedentota bacterium]